ncbi:unnamed protein product [Ectocarpus sp. 12 AP-2014]
MGALYWPVGLVYSVTARAVVLPYLYAACLNPCILVVNARAHACRQAWLSAQAPSSLHELVLRVVLVQKKLGEEVLTQIVCRRIRIDPSDVGPSGFCVPCFA